MSNVNDPEKSLTVSMQTMDSSTSSITIDCNICNTSEKTEIYLELASYPSESEDNNEIRGANNENKLTSDVEHTIEYTDSPDITSTAASTDDSAISSSTIQDTVDGVEKQSKLSLVNQVYDIREEPSKDEKIINNEATSMAISTIYDEIYDEDTGVEIKQKTESNEEKISKNNELENNNKSNNNGDNDAKIENMMARKEENSPVVLTELNLRMDFANEDATTKDSSINSYREQQQQQDNISALVTEVVQGQGGNDSATDIETNKIIGLEKDNEQVLLIVAGNHPEIERKSYDESDKICFIQGQPEDKKQPEDHSGGQTIFHLESESDTKEEKEAGEKESSIAQQEQEALLTLEIFARKIVECEIRKYIESIIATIDDSSAIIIDTPQDKTAETETILKADIEADPKEALNDISEIETAEVPEATGQAVTQSKDVQLAARDENTLEQTSDHSERVEDEKDLVDPGQVEENNLLAGVKQDVIEQAVASKSSDFIERERISDRKNDDDDNGERNDKICDTKEQVETVIISSTIKGDMALNSDHAISSDSSDQQLLKSNTDATDSTKPSIAEISDDTNLADDELDNDVDDDEKEPIFVARRVVMKRNKNPRDEYSLKEELGRGKFGTVYKCSDNTNGTLLAAKFIHLRRREDREDVEREVDIMKSLQHKRLLQLYDAFDDGHNEMCLIMELVEGGELFERVIDDDFKLTEKMAAIFMRQICEGVRYMHEQNIVHLDMKPENILCVSKRSNRIKLIDFGLARRLEANSKLQVLFGTPDFAAPEVLSYDTVTLATDMWSVGVICYVLLSGLSPFMGDTDLETMTNVTKAAYDFEDEAFDPISDSARDFISRLLVKDQALRMTPSECLVHNWLTKTQLTSANVQRDSEGNGAFDQSLDKTKLRKYVVRRKWQKAIHAILALRRMGATF